MLYLDDKIFMPDFPPSAMKYGINSSEVKIGIYAKSVDLHQIGLFTPTYYFPYGCLGGGEKLNIPKTSYFVLGDNSSFSDDSRTFEVCECTTKSGEVKLLPRTADFGPDIVKQTFIFCPFVKSEDFIAKAFAVVFPTIFTRKIK